MGEELAGDHPAAGGADQIQGAALHDVEERQAAPARAIVAFPLTRVAHFVPDQRHSVVMEIGEQNFAGLPGLTELTAARQLHVDVVRGDVQTVVLLALRRNHHHFPAAISVEYRRAECFFDGDALIVE